MSKLLDTNDFLNKTIQSFRFSTLNYFALKYNHDQNSILRLPSYDVK